MVCWSDQQLAAALRAQGVGAGSAAILVATSHPESGGCGVMQQGQPYATTGWGPWQITPGNSESQCGSNGTLNSSLTASACAAAAKLRGGGLGQWTTYTSGKYIPFLSAARQAVSQVYGMSASEVQRLINSAPAGASGGQGANANANTTGFLGGALDPFANILGDVTNALGLPNPKDALIRLGLVLLGGAVILIGLITLVTKTSVGQAALTVVAPEATPERRAAAQRRQRSEERLSEQRQLRAERREERNAE